MQFAALAFDLDNTLVATEQVAITHLVESLQRDFGIPLTLETFMQRYHGVGGAALVVRLNADFNTAIDPALWVPRRNAEVVDLFTRVGVEAAPELEPVLLFLEQNKQNVCLVSNSAPARIAATLNATRGVGERLKALFGDNIFSGEAADIPKGKPHPAVYEKAARVMGFSPSKALAVEDSPAGVLSAVAAGYEVWGYTGLSDHPEELAVQLVGAGAKRILRTWAGFMELLQT